MPGETAESGTDPAGSGPSGSGVPQADAGFPLTGATGATSTAGTTGTTRIAGTSGTTGSAGTTGTATAGTAGTAGTLPLLRASLEAILLVVDEPVAEVVLAQVLERPRDEVAAVLRELAAEYTEQGRGFDLREVAGGWRFYTRAECAPVVERFVRDGQEVRLTQAALETLAVVAYRQPVSRSRVSAVRGVNCDGVMRTLVLRGLVDEAGADAETGAILYRTTGYFLERLGLRDLEELPDLDPFLPDDVEDIEREQTGN
jgi:segregation and condensation protein B